MNLNEIELIVAIREKSKTVPWRYDLLRKVLSGVLGDFRFELSVFIHVLLRWGSVQNFSISKLNLQNKIYYAINISLKSMRFFLHLFIDFLSFVILKLLRSLKQMLS